MQRYLLGVSYLGRKYSGWPPINPANGKSVVCALNSALNRFIGENNYTELQVSSRTDAGVNALRNTFSVDLVRKHRQTGDITIPHSSDAVYRGLNSYLREQKEELRILDVTPVLSDFNIRKNTTSRTYEYHIIMPPPTPILSSSSISSSSSSSLSVDLENNMSLLSKGQVDFSPGSDFNSKDYILSHCELLYNKRAWFINQNCNIELMKDAAKVLVGINDFTSFRNSGCTSKSPIRHIKDITISQSPLNFVASPLLTSINEIEDVPIQLKIRLRANAFVYRMMRNIVSTLVSVGKGDMTTNDVIELLNAKDRTIAPKSAPAKGLYLMNVHYDKLSNDIMNGEIYLKR